MKTALLAALLTLELALPAAAFETVALSEDGCSIRIVNLTDESVEYRVLMYDGEAFVTLSPGASKVYDRSGAGPGAAQYRVFVGEELVAEGYLCPLEAPPEVASDDDAAWDGDEVEPDVIVDGPEVLTPAVVAPPHRDPVRPLVKVPAQVVAPFIVNYYPGALRAV